MLDELTSGLDSHIAQNVVDIAIDAMKASGEPYWLVMHIKSHKDLTRKKDK